MKKKKRLIAFKEITFTKVIAMTFILPWLTILVLQTIHLWFEVGNDLTSVLNATGTVVAVVASGYFARSGYDQYTGYKYGQYGQQINDYQKEIDYVGD